MKGYLVDVKANESRVVDFEDDLDVYYKMLDCDLIDIASRTVCGKWFEIVCDDEALLKDGAVPSAVDKNMGSMLYGSLLFCHSGENGELTGLTDDDIELLKKNTKTFFRVGGEGKLVIVTNMDWV